MLHNRKDNVMAIMGDSLSDVIRWLDDEPRQWRQNSSRQRGSRDWDLGVGWEGAVKLAREGWEEGVKRIHSELTAHFPQSFVKEPPWRHDVGGALPDVPRYLQGMPDHMWDRGRAKGSKPIVHIVINTVCSAWTTAQQFVNYGAAITALIDEIEASGRRVELDIAAVFRSLGGYGRGSFTGIVGWKVKRAGEHVDLAAISFGLAHPAAFRRIQFAMIERTPTNWDTPGYGMCGGLTKAHAKLLDCERAFLLDGVGEAGSACNTAEGALNLARAQLARAEEKVHAEQEDA